MIKIKYIQIFISCKNKKEALELSNLLLKEKLAACVQLLPIKSLYLWNGKIERANEYLCLIKTINTKFENLVLKIKKHHSYKIPEILVMDIKDGNKDYFKWIERELKS
ncbi:MAG: divalent-cation tolerance protein CutA [Candidatus Micrarchaeia archaeon]